MTPQVVDVPDRQRYEIVRDDAVLGYAAYQRTEQLVRGALDHVRTLDLRVLPICPFVQAWMSRHPDYIDLDYRRPPSKVTD